MARSVLRDQLRPVELVGLSAVLALFAGLIVLLATREWLLALIFFGVAFIVALVVTAMFALTMKPNSDELRELAGEDLTAKRDARGAVTDVPPPASPLSGDDGDGPAQPR